MSALNAYDTHLTVLSAEDAVKRELARELHDQVAQTLTSMLIEIEEFKIGQSGRVGVLREMDTLQGYTRNVLHNIRQMLYGLRDQPMVDVDFPDTVRTGLLRSFEERTGIEIVHAVSPSWPTVIKSHAAASLHRILQEALTNVQRHSGATTVEVCFLREGDLVTVSVADNGTGFRSGPEGRREGMGILGMRERVVLLGGDLVIQQRPEGGAVLVATFPLEAIA